MHHILNDQFHTMVISYHILYNHLLPIEKVINYPQPLTPKSWIPKTKAFINFFKKRHRIINFLSHLNKLIDTQILGKFKAMQCKKYSSFMDVSFNSAKPFLRPSANKTAHL